MTSDESAEGTCRVCGDTVPVDGKHAIERWGDVLCQQCSNEPVRFKATCSSELCDWSFTVDEDEFNRGHAKTRAQQEANQHEKMKEVLDEDPMHRTSVTEVTSS